MNALMRSERNAYMSSEGLSIGNKSNGYRELSVFGDGTVVKLLRDGRYANECFYIVLGVTEDNRREVRTA